MCWNKNYAKKIIRKIKYNNVFILSLSDKAMKLILEVMTTDLDNDLEILAHTKY